jgi:hypothetical protein
VTTQPEAGELLVGSYLRLVNGCEVVSYNQRSDKEGEQLEVDVLGLQKTADGEMNVYVCEVVTHLNGLSYSGTPDTDRWEQFGNSNYQYSLERLWRKFGSDKEYAETLFDFADSYTFQLWSPIVRGDSEEEYLLGGLHALADEFEAETDNELDLVINDTYTKKIRELEQVASTTEKGYGELGFRMLQILEHLQ